VREQIPVETVRPSLRMLSDEGVRNIHNASLEILEKTGIEMQDSHGRELLLEAGAWESGGRIHVPERIVENALSSAPSRIPMHDRLGRLAMPLELGKVYFGPGSDTTFTLDLESGERRRATAQDAENMAHIADALGNLDFVMSMSNPSDVEIDDLYLHAFMGMLRGSTKPIVYTAQDRKDMEAIYRISTAVAGDEKALREKPFLLQYAEPISPLLIPEESLQKIIFCAEKGIPSCYIPSANTGGGGPITLAGAVALGNAETLLGLIITQLIRPGAPYLYGMNTAALDMKTTIISYGAPEWSLGMGAWTELARAYNLPVWGYAGATDSKLIDAQAGAEIALSIMIAYLTRCTLNHDVGYMEYGSTSSAELMILADEVIDMVHFMLKGLEINPATLALDAIAQVTPGGGFLAEDHTLEHWREAQWFPKLMDRSRYDEWVQAGSKDAFARANTAARKILSEHEVPALAPEVEETFAEVLKERAQSR
jgi:trimethylamine--corrinoid protein Co-methyltransferase